MKPKDSLRGAGATGRPLWADPCATQAPCTGLAPPSLRPTRDTRFLLFLGLLCAFAPTPEVNLLTNGSFEKIHNGAPEGWKTDGGLVTFSIETDTPAEGKNYLRIQGEAPLAWAETVQRVPIDR